MTTISQKIRMTLAYLQVSEAELARRLGMTPQNLWKRLRVDKWTDSDLDAIAKALKIEITVLFKIPNGPSIE